MSSFCTAKATHIFFSKKFQHICISLNVNFNESLTNIVSFEQLDDVYKKCRQCRPRSGCFLSVWAGSTLFVHACLSKYFGNCGFMLLFLWKYWVKSISRDTAFPTRLHIGPVKTQISLHFMQFKSPQGTLWVAKDPESLETNKEDVQADLYLG